MHRNILFCGLLSLICVAHGADQSEGEKCDLDSENVYGRCGETLVCTPFDTEKFGVCQCVSQDELCGTNGKTYPNLCRLVQDAIRLGENNLKTAHLGKCIPEVEKTAPVISDPPPENVLNATGGYIAISCEAYGNPIPDIVWTFRPLDGKETKLPGDDIKVSAYIRGGPEKHEVTAWLQIMDLELAHEGDYFCIATSSLGSDKAMARIKVFEKDLVRVKRKDL